MTAGQSPDDQVTGGESMEKKIAGLLGAVAALGAVNAAQAAQAPSPAPSEVMRANSFADLLEPIPNAASLLQAIDESEPAQPTDSNVQLAQLSIEVGPRRHHHHHHHHHGYGRRIVVVPRFRHHHHHHHHHHGYYRRRDY
jgi:hypothetical protein